MYRIALCDDEKDDRERIYHLVDKILNQKSIAFEVEQFDSSKALLQYEHGTGAWDLMILDIMMDGQNGIELAKELRNMGEETDIIFVTVSPEFALAGYEAWPISYLLKPLSESAFEDVLNRCLKKVSKAPFLIMDWKNGGQIEFKLRDIYYIEVFGKELVVHTGTDSYSCLGSMQDIYAQLPQSQFFRSHRSFTVNLDYVNRIRRYEYILADNRSVPIAKGNWQTAKSVWVSYHVQGGM